MVYWGRLVEHSSPTFKNFAWAGQQTHDLFVYFPTLYQWATVSPQFKLDLSKVTKWDWNYNNVCHDFGHTCLSQIWMLYKYALAHYMVLTLKQARALLANTFIKFTRAGERTQDLKKLFVSSHFTTELQWLLYLQMSH